MCGHPLKMFRLKSITFCLICIACFATLGHLSPFHLLAQAEVAERATSAIPATSVVRHTEGTSGATSAADEIKADPVAADPSQPTLSSQSLDAEGKSAPTQEENAVRTEAEHISQAREKENTAKKASSPALASSKSENKSSEPTRVSTHTLSNVEVEESESHEAGAPGEDSGTVAENEELGGFRETGSGYSTLGGLQPGTAGLLLLSEYSRTAFQQLDPSTQQKLAAFLGSLSVDQQENLLYFNALLESVPTSEGTKLKQLLAHVQKLQNPQESLSNFAAITHPVENTSHPVGGQLESTYPPPQPDPSFYLAPASNYYHRAGSAAAAHNDVSGTNNVYIPPTSTTTTTISSSNAPSHGPAHAMPYTSNNDSFISTNTFPVQSTSGSYANSTTTYPLNSSSGSYASSTNTRTIHSTSGSYASSTNTRPVNNTTGSYASSTNTRPIHSTSGSYASSTNTRPINSTSGSYASSTNARPVNNTTGSYASGTNTRPIHSTSGSYASSTNVIPIISSSSGNTRPLTSAPVQGRMYTSNSDSVSNTTETRLTYSNSNNTRPRATISSAPKSQNASASTSNASSFFTPAKLTSAFYPNWAADQDGSTSSDHGHRPPPMSGMPAPEPHSVETVNLEADSRPGTVTRMPQPLTVADAGAVQYKQHPTGTVPPPPSTRGGSAYQDAPVRNTLPQQHQIPATQQRFVPNAAAPPPSRPSPPSQQQQFYGAPPPPSYAAPPQSSYPAPHPPATAPHHVYATPPAPPSSLERQNQYASATQQRLHPHPSLSSEQHRHQQQQQLQQQQNQLQQPLQQQQLQQPQKQLQQPQNQLQQPQQQLQQPQQQLQQPQQQLQQQQHQQLQQHPAQQHQQPLNQSLQHAYRTPGPMPSLQPQQRPYTTSHSSSSSHNLLQQQSQSQLLQQRQYDPAGHSPASHVSPTQPASYSNSRAVVPEHQHLQHYNPSLQQHYTVGAIAAGAAPGRAAAPQPQSQHYLYNPSPSNPPSEAKQQRVIHSMPQQGMRPTHYPPPDRTGQHHHLQQLDHPLPQHTVQGPHPPQQQRTYESNARGRGPPNQGASPYSTEDLRGAANQPFQLPQPLLPDLGQISLSGLPLLDPSAGLSALSSVTAPLQQLLSPHSAAKPMRIFRSVPSSASVPNSLNSGGGTYAQEIADAGSVLLTPVADALRLINNGLVEPVVTHANEVLRDAHELNARVQQGSVQATQLFNEISAYRAANPDAPLSKLLTTLEETAASLNNNKEEEASSATESRVPRKLQQTRTKSISPVGEEAGNSSGEKNMKSSDKGNLRRRIARRVGHVAAEEEELHPENPQLTSFHDVVNAPSMHTGTGLAQVSADGNAVANSVPNENESSTAGGKNVVSGVATDGKLRPSPQQNVPSSTEKSDKSIFTTLAVSGKDHNDVSSSKTELFVGDDGDVNGFQKIKNRHITYNLTDENDPLNLSGFGSNNSGATNKSSDVSRGENERKSEGDESTHLPDEKRAGRMSEVLSAMGAMFKFISERMPQIRNNNNQ